MIPQPTIGRSLSDICPEFKAKMVEYTRATKTSQDRLARIFREAEEIAREFWNRERPQ